MCVCRRGTVRYSQTSRSPPVFLFCLYVLFFSLDLKCNLVPLVISSNEHDTAVQRVQTLGVGGGGMQSSSGAGGTSLRAGGLELDFHGGLRLGRRDSKSVHMCSSTRAILLVYSRIKWHYLNLFQTDQQCSNLVVFRVGRGLY